MANYTVSPTHHGLYNKTLTAGTDVITVDKDVSDIVIRKHSGDAAYYTLDGSAPVVEDPATFQLPQDVYIEEDVPVHFLASDDKQIKIITAGTINYSILFS